MAKSTVKAVALARELLDVWNKEVAASFSSIVETFDTDGNPIITLSDGTPATTEKVVVVRITPIDWTAYDSLGLTSQIYTPHKADICTETNAAGAPNILTPAELLFIVAELAKRGLIINWYRSAAGTVPATAQMVAANLGATWEDLYWNAQKAQ